VQQRLRRKEFELRKVGGVENPADLFTKHMDSANKLNGLVALYGCEFRSGRAEAAPNLKRRQQVAMMGAEYPSSLPHTMKAEDIDREYPVVEPDEEIEDEHGDEPLQDMRDPVPKLKGQKKERAGHEEDEDACAACYYEGDTDGLRPVPQNGYAGNADFKKREPPSHGGVRGDRSNGNDISPPYGEERGLAVNPMGMKRPSTDRRRQRASHRQKRQRGRAEADGHALSACSRQAISQTRLASGLISLIHETLFKFKR
jgi:hypothetical protein